MDEKIKQAMDFMPGHGLIFLEKQSVQTISRENEEKVCGERVGEHWRRLCCQARMCIFQKDNYE